MIDRVVPADQPLGDDLPAPWAIPADLPTDLADGPIEVLSSILGGLTIVSIGNADADGVRSIEPLVEEINDGQGAWVIRALVARDSKPVARTFLVGHIGWWTIYEVTDSGVVDRTPPVEGVPTPTPTDDPRLSWPPEGVLDVPMPELGTGRTPKTGVVDRTGLLLEARSVREGDPPRPNLDLQAGEMAVVQAGPDTVIAHWNGTLCDDRLVLTVYGGGPVAPPDSLEVRGESADQCRLALVHYGMVLRFSQAVDATAIEGLARVGTPYEAFPPVHSTVVSLPKAGGGFDLPKVRAALVDLSGRVTSVRLPRPDESRPNDRRDGPGLIVPDPAVAGRYHLMWNGGLCTPDIVITIDATLSNVLVSNPVTGDCDTIGNEYRLILDIDGPVGVPAVEVRYADTSAGAS